MKWIKVSVFVALFFAAIAIFGLGGIRSWHTEELTKPEISIRTELANVQPVDIAYIKIQTLTVRKQVRDNSIIAKLLSGLKNASVPDPLIKNRINTITLYLRSGKQLGPYTFSLEREVDSFSPEFTAGLKQLGIHLSHQ